MSLIKKLFFVKLLNFKTGKIIQKIQNPLITVTSTLSIV